MIFLLWDTDFVFLGSDSHNLDAGRILCGQLVWRWWSSFTTIDQPTIIIRTHHEIVNLGPYSNWKTLDVSMNLYIRHSFCCDGPWILCHRCRCSNSKPTIADDIFIWFSSYIYIFISQFHLSSVLWSFCRPFFPDIIPFRFDIYFVIFYFFSFLSFLFYLFRFFFKF